MGERTRAKGGENATPRARKARIEAVAYLRTSSAANVGADKDSDKRQRRAIEAFAKGAGLALVGEFYDAAVSGADPIEGRRGFAALLDRIEGKGVRTVIVEAADRFARELMVQELGIALLIKRGVRLLTASGDDLTASDDPSRKMMRQIAGSFAEYEKARLVAKLRAAREAKRQSGSGGKTLDGKSKCGGRQSLTERAEALAKRGDNSLVHAIALAKRLHRASPKTGERMSLRDIAHELARAGHVTVDGWRFNAATVKAMIDGPIPKEGA